jgi:hypothetical protein
MLPDDPNIENLDPFMRAWMFNHWVEDYNDNWKLLENVALLIGSFENPEAVRKILGKDSETFRSSDKDFEDTTRQIEEASKILTEKEKRAARRRRKVKE